MSLLTLSAEVRKWISLVAVAAALLFIASLSVGRWSCGKKETKLPPVKEGHVDQGKQELPPPPPLEGPPTFVTEYVPVPSAPLSEQEIVAKARALGMIFVTAEQAVEEGVKPGELVDGEFRLFAQETFGPGPCGDTLTCYAWQPAKGERLDLIGRWAPYQPPPVEEAKQSVFANEARWHFWAGPALLSSDEATGLGFAGGADYTGFRLWKLQSEFHVVAGYSEETGKQAIAALAFGF